MKRSIYLVITFFSVFFFFNDLPAQAVFGPVRAKYTREIHEALGTVSSYGIFSDTESRIINIGKYTTTRKRVIFQWDIPETSIPDGSTISSVTVKFIYSKSTADGYSPDHIPVKFFNVGIDVVNTDNLNSIWNVTDPSVQNSGIGRADGVADPENLGNYREKVEVIFPGTSAMAGAISGALTSDKFILGVAWEYESSIAGNKEWGVCSDCYLTVNFSPKEQPLTVYQILSNSNSYGSIEVHNGTEFQQHLAPYTFSPYINSVQLIRADTNKATVADEKFNFWNNNTDVINHKTLTIVKDIPPLTAYFRQIGSATIKNALEGVSSVTGDIVSFKDPWLRDDDSDPKGLKNRGGGAIWHSYTSPFVQNISSTKFKGVLLNQPANTTNPHYYSVLAKQTFDAPLSQTGKTHKFYFQNWTSTNAVVTYPKETETPVVFTANNSEVLANYKGTQLSNTQSAFSNSSQRKFIRTPNDGYYHLVYESMGKIWYERSIDGVNWILGNNGKPLNTDYVYDKMTGQTTGTGIYTTAKHPSIDYCNGKVFVVFQEASGSGYRIRIATLENGTKIGRLANDIPFTTYGQYSEDVYPEIAIKDDGHAAVALRRNDLYLKGLEVHYIMLYLTEGTSKERTYGWIQGTDQNTGVFALATDRNSTDKFHIAWEQGGSIQYAKLNFTYTPGDLGSPNSSMASQDNSRLGIPPDGSWDMNVLETVNVSNATSTTASFQPSMIAASDGTARLAFKGYEEYEPGAGDGWYFTLLVNPDNTSWIPYLNKYGGEVFSPQISLGSETYIVGWTELYDYSTYRTICTDASTLRDMEFVQSASGRDIQINMGGTRAQQFAMGFNSESSTLPYSFRQSSAIGTIVANKTIPVSNGRGVYLTKDQSQIYFIMGNVNAGGMNVNFAEVKDSVRLEDNIKKVNSYLQTEPFSLKANSTFSFAVRYGARDSVVASRSMKKGEFATFKLDLIDDASGRVVGSYLDEKVDKDNIFRMRESVMRLKSEGLEGRLLRLRLSVGENMKSRYTISDLLMGGGLPLSKSIKEKDLNSSVEVREYSLSQNYPNPFNPSTLISYALPKASKVSLKVYDILGKEVATLVNGYEEMGKYSVEFNASSLPSGIYIYEIRANDFVKSGKMMLLK